MKPRRIETLLPLMIELVITQMTLVYVFVYITIEIFLAFFNEIFKIQAVTKIPVVRMRNCGSHETFYAHTNVKHSKINKGRKKVTFEPPWKWRKKDSKMLISFKWTVFVRMYWKARWGKAEINYVKDQKMPLFSVQNMSQNLTLVWSKHLPKYLLPTFPSMFEELFLSVRMSHLMNPKYVCTVLYVYKGQAQRPRKKARLHSLFIPNNFIFTLDPEWTKNF